MAQRDTRQLLAEALARQLPGNAPEAARRRFIQRAGMALFASSFAPATLLAAAAAPASRPRFTANPFSLGVASGYPRPDSVVLWTRLACEPLNNGGIVEARHSVDVEVADDVHFGKLVRSATNIPAYATLGHSVHVEPRGLQPDREYFYRFRCGDWVSPTGRTRTAPALDAKPRELKFALASCQHYEQGYFKSYPQMLADGADLIVFVGDYIYESSWGSTLIRRHQGPDATDLVGYRNRHAQYKLDPDLQAAHAALPWIFTWDDHEVSNDYAGDQSESLEPWFLLRRAAAYQAYYEHMPLPRHMLPRGDGMRIYDTLDYGNLARFCMVDNRQYRSAQSCPDENRAGSRNVEPTVCTEMADPARTMLGSVQEAWLDEQFKTSNAHWNVLGQQTLFAHQVLDDTGVDRVWTDAWDGYPAARERLLASIQRHRLRNPLILGGDVHAFYVNDIHRDGTDNTSDRLALELCATSLNADGLPQSLLDGWRKRNAHIHLSRADVRGYALLTLTPESATTDLRVVDDARALEPGVSTLATFHAARAEDGWES